MKLDTKLTKEDLGTTRTKEVFAYAPTTLDNCDKVWLSNYNIEEKVVEGISVLKIKNKVFYWKIIRKYIDVK